MGRFPLDSPLVYVIGMARNPPVDSPTPELCLQCDSPMPGKFCSECGQSARVGPLRFKSLIGEAITSVVDLELPILRTTKGLLLAPGRTAGAWVDGRRKTFTNPIKYCVIVGVLFTLVIRFQLADAASIESGGQPGAGQATYTLSSLFQEYVAFLLMLLAVPFAPIAGMLSRVLKVRRSSTDWYALFLYCLGISLLLQMLSGFVSSTVAEFASILPAVFLLWGGWQFGKVRWRSFLVALISLVSWVALLAWAQSLLR